MVILILDTQGEQAVSSNKSFAKLTKTVRVMTQINKVRDEREKLQQTLRKSQESWGHTLKICILLNWKNLKEPDGFLDANDPPQRNQDKENDFYRSVATSQTELEAVIKNFPTKKSTSQMDLAQNSTRPPKNTHQCSLNCNIK